MADDVVLTIGADTSGAERKVRSFANELERAAGSARKLDTANKGAGRSTAGFVDEAERMENVGRLLGGTFGNLGNAADDLGKILKGGVSTATVFTAALAGVVAVAGLLAANSINVARNLDTVTDSMSRMERQGLAPQLAALKESQAALAGMDKRVQELEVRLAADMAPTVTKNADAMSGWAIAAGRAQEILKKHRQEAPLLEGEILKTADAVQILAEGFDQLAEAGANARREVFDPEGFGKEVAGFGDAVVKAAEKSAQAQKAAADAAARAEAERNAAAAAMPLYGSVSPTGLFNPTAQNIDDALTKIGRDRAEKMLADARARREEAERQHQQELDRINQEGEARRLQAIQDAAQQEMEIRSAALGAISQIAGAVTGLIVEGMDKEVAATEAGRRQQVQQQKRAATAQALIGGALAIVQGFAQLGPIAGAVAAAGTAIVTGVQIAAIGNANYHVGGVLAPDEMMMGGSRIRRNEPVGIFTAQAADELGPQGMRDVTGTGRTGGGVRDIWVLTDDGPRRAREFARPRLLGKAAAAGRH